VGKGFLFWSKQFGTFAKTSSTFGFGQSCKFWKNDGIMRAYDDKENLVRKMLEIYKGIGV
jgi:hypothetical protein